MQNERLVDVSGLQAALRTFTAARGWDRFHSPKNLAMALTGEIGELIEHFQWLTEDESRAAMRDAERAAGVRDEMADVMIYFCRLADVLGVDLDAAVGEKLRRNAERFPVGR